MSIDVYPPRNYTQYEEGSFTVTATGFSGTAPSGTARYVRIGKQVTLSLPQLSGTSNATTFTLTGVPVALRGYDFFTWVQCADNGINGNGFLAHTGGNWTVYWLAGAGFAWTASGSKTAQFATVSYVLL